MRPRFCILIFLVLLPLTGCSPPSALPAADEGDAVAQFPTGEALRAGDILLGRSYGMVGAMFARFGATPGLYSHAALVFEDEDGSHRVINFRPFGMEVCSASDYASRYNRLALVRSRLPVDAEALSRSARNWLRINDADPVEPDYQLDRSDQSQLFCLELVSSIYDEAGLPDPFERVYRVEDYPVVQRVLQDFNLEIQEIPSPNSVLESSRFAVVDTWADAEYDWRKSVLDETILESMKAYYADGYTVRPPRFGGRIKINLLLSLFHMRRLFSPYRRHATIPEFVGQQAIDTGFMFYQHVSFAKKRAFRQLAQLPRDCPPEQVRSIAREASDHYRDVFFMISPEQETPPVASPHSLSCETVAIQNK